MTEPIFRSDAYARDCEATVTAITSQGGIVTDRTVFYAAAGGQPSDQGIITIEDRTIAITATTYGEDRATIVHVPAAGSEPPPVGSRVRLTLAWPMRHKLMRMHTALHLLCSLVKFPVTGGQVGAEEGRLDFDIEDASTIDKDRLGADLNALIAADHAISTRWISDAELEANPHLVRTMSVKPPMGSGKVRLVLIGPDGAVDMQPCGGTHVRSTGEIGPVQVTKVEKKGRLNRRIRLAWS